MYSAMSIYAHYHDIMHWEAAYRKNIINSVSGFKSANLLGTVDEASNENLALFSSVHHIGAHPPLLGFNLRPTSVARHTYQNLITTGFFTINAVSRDMFRQAHHTSARYPRHESEFQAAGLTPAYLCEFPAPFVKESPLQIGLRFEESHQIRANQTHLIVGRVECLRLPNQVVSPQGKIDLEALQLVTISGLDTYHVTSKLDQLPYAKPHTKK